MYGGNICMSINTDALSDNILLELKELTFKNLLNRSVIVKTGPFFLWRGFTFAIFKLVGKIPVSTNWLTIKVRVATGKRFSDFIRYIVKIFK